VSLYRGDFLEGLSVREAPFEAWLQSERERLRETIIEALARLVSHHTQAGNVTRAVQCALRLVSLDPLQESVHRALMRLNVRQGRRGAALKQYEACVVALRRELAVEPEAETRHLYQEILRGRSELPLAADDAVRVRRSKPASSPRSSVPAADVALVGRRAELARVRAAFEHAQQGRGGVVMILGEAGIGKSRLVEELTSGRIGTDARVLVGHCHEAEQVLPFRPWIDAIRSGGILDDGELRDGLDPLWRAELGRLWPEWAPADAAPQQPFDHLRMFEGAARLLESLAAREPVVVVLEDLHWADEMSVRLLSFVARRAVAHPMLVIGTAREEELVDAALLRGLIGALGREDLVERVVLAPLTEHETSALARAVAQHGGDEHALDRLARDVWRLSEGNPFVALEAVRAADRSGMPQGGSLALPERVSELTARRLEHLSAEARHLAIVAAVIGSECDFALLCRAGGVDERSGTGLVEELVARRVLHVVGERLDLTHARIREVARMAALPPRRRLLHAEVARAMVALYGVQSESHQSAIGLHYFAAEDWEAAVEPLLAGGRHAAGRCAFREAAVCFDKALTALERVPRGTDWTARVVDVRLELRLMYTSLGDHQSAIAQLRTCRTLAREAGDAIRLGWVHASLASCLTLVGQHDEAVEAGLRALDDARATGVVPLQVWANYYLGIAYYVRGDYRLARECLTSNVRVLADDPTAGGGRQRFAAPVVSRAMLAAALAELGAFEEGEAHTMDAIGEADALGDAEGLALACFGAGAIHVRSGAFERGLAELQRGLDICRARDMPLIGGLIVGAIAYGLLFLGRGEEALALLESTTVADSYPIARTTLAHAHLLAGRVGTAREHAARAHAECVRRRERGSEAWALRLLGEVAAASEPPDLAAAGASYRRSLELAEELGMRPLMAHCHLGLAKSTSEAGSAAAQAHLAAAVEQYEALGMTYWRERASAVRP
jgi:tetratricopeptide (TPR) repeat protein